MRIEDFLRRYSESAFTGRQTHRFQEEARQIRAAVGGWPRACGDLFHQADHLAVVVVLGPLSTTPMSCPGEKARWTSVTIPLSVHL